MDKPDENNEVERSKAADAPHEEYLLTDLLSTINHKLFDGILGVFRRALHFLIRGWKTFFSRQMFHFALQGLLLVILGIAFLAAVFLPFVLMWIIPGLGESDILAYIGVFWVLFIGVVGVWQGIRNGEKLRKRWRQWRARSKASKEL